MSFLSVTVVTSRGTRVAEASLLVHSSSETFQSLLEGHDALAAVRDWSYDRVGLRIHRRGRCVRTRAIQTRFKRWSAANIALQRAVQLLTPTSHTSRHHTQQLVDLGHAARRVHLAGLRRFRGGRGLAGRVHPARRRAPPHRGRAARLGAGAPRHECPRRADDAAARARPATAQGRSHCPWCACGTCSPPQRVGRVARCVGLRLPQLRPRLARQGAHGPAARGTSMFFSCFNWEGGSTTMFAFSWGVGLSTFTQILTNFSISTHHQHTF